MLLLENELQDVTRVTRCELQDALYAERKPPFPNSSFSMVNGTKMGVDQAILFMSKQETSTKVSL